jgi:hypothetical protein
MQIEYATDTVFRRREDLQRLYQPLVRTAVHAIKADHIAKFLGRKAVSQSSKTEIGTDLGTRIEGTRIKHWMAKSSLKKFVIYPLPTRRSLRIVFFSKKLALLMAYGLWLMAYGLWLMAYGLWLIASIEHCNCHQFCDPVVQKIAGKELISCSGHGTCVAEG